ncbi:MAG: type II toxin-antitoxin system HipA family toxin [Deltaproteobacteria bacterium]|nr:type II toxin-antitoxin system HipA family toxin [Deltaproteobacteria bacterium]
MKKLYAYFESKKVGVLTKDNDDVYSFEYEKSWREDPNAFAISLSMPVQQEEKFGNKVTLSFFENLLPEGDVRKELETAYKISGVFDFLAEFGRDCAGAIIVTKQPDYQAPAGPLELVSIDMKKIHAAIEERLSVAEVISETSPGYLSLAGAQDKFPAVLRDGKFYLPKNGHPTTHIVKVPIWRRGVKESVYNEYYCMQLAKAVGLEIPSCQVIDGDHPLFVIERYDRATSKADGSVHRIHQQDLCQAQGISSKSKYEVRGGPSLKQNYEFVREHVSAAHRYSSMERLLDWVCFNLVIGNNDSHSKNVSLLLHQKSKYLLAPFYDLMSTAIYEGLDPSFSFRIGDRDEFSKIGKNQIELLETQLGLKQYVFKKRLQGVVDRILAHYKSLSEQVHAQFPNAKIPKRINDLIDTRIKSLKFQKAL